MKPHEADEFRQFFTLKKPDPSQMNTALDKAHRAIGKVEQGTPLQFSSQSPGNRLQFKVNMNMCVWR